MPFRRSWLRMCRILTCSRCRFARQWRDEHRGKWFTVPKLSGFCLLVKSAPFMKRSAGSTSGFGLGFYDDDDLAERARRAGFGLAVAQDLFVHHFGSRTFVGNGVDAGRVLDENAKRFAEKWGDSVPRGVRIGLKAFPGGPRGTGGHGFWEKVGPFERGIVTVMTARAMVRILSRRPARA